MENNKSNYDTSQQMQNAAKGAQIAVQAAKRYAAQDYVGGTIITVVNIRYLSAAIVVFILLPLLLIIMLPAVLLTANHSITDQEGMFDVYQEIHIKVNSYFEEAFIEAYSLANERAYGKSDNYDDIYEITVEIISPYENNDFIEISNSETNEIMAIHGIVSQYDKSSEYNDISVVMRDFSDLDGPDDVYDKKFFKTVRKYAKNIYSVGNASFIDTGTRKEIIYIKNENGEIIVDDVTGEPLTYELEINTGKVTVEITKDTTRYFEEEIENVKQRAWEYYSENLRSGYTLIKNKTKNQTDAEVELQISDMKKNLQLMFAENNQDKDVNVVASKRDEIIKRFLDSTEYTLWKDRHVSSYAQLPYKNNVISSEYGWRLLYGEGNFHNAIDFSWGGCRLADIPSIDDGIVVYAFGDCTVDEEPSLGYGNLVIIYHGKKNGYDFFTLYGHCEQVYVNTGQTVNKGQTIGGIGKRGNSTGYHLHFETIIPMGGQIKAVNPKDWLLEK